MSIKVGKRPAAATGELETIRASILQEVETIRASILQEVEAANTATEESIITGIRNNLVSVPEQGETWNEKKSYITGDVVTLDGVSYTATHYSRGKSPEAYPDKWTLTPTEETYGAWADIEDGSVITEGTKVSHNDKSWVCVAQHIKSSVYSPRTNSTKWEEISE